jgi:type IV pilus assembly protein PilY1
MSKLTRCAILATTMLAVQLPAAAEDIDLFAPLPRDESGRPNVLIILDNTANWNTAFTNEINALVDTFDGLPLDEYNVGLMFFGAPETGYIRAAIRPMDETNRPLYSSMIANLHRTNDAGNARTLARTFSEAYRYLNGLDSVAPSVMTSSPHTTKRDFLNNTAGNAYDDAVHARTGNALANAAAYRYNAPINEIDCAGTFIIYIGNTVPSGNVVKDNSSRNTSAGNELAALGGNISQIALTYSSHQDNYADEWARFLKESMGVITYVIDLDPTPMPGGQTNGMGNSALLASMANVSGGQYFRVNSSEGGGARITDTMNNIFSQIKTKDSAFASVSLPLSVSTQGTYLNQLYVGMFRPDGLTRPRWFGNLKQYRLGVVGGALTTVDADGAEATNPSTGFVAECGRSYWTTTDTYWSFRPATNCDIGTAAERAARARSNNPDGDLTEKGAQAQVLRSLSPASRNMKTCNTFTCPTTPTALPNFNDGNTSITATALGAADATERTALINYQRGADVNDEDTDGNLTEMRSSAHGDVIHSRPVAVNYGTDATPQVVVFYGGNDGVLRAVNGNRDTAINSVAAGQEIWSFVAPEFFGSIRRLKTNSPKVRFVMLDDLPEYSDADATNDPTPKAYGLDGSVVAYKSGTSTWIYSTARRGGRVVYAFDVSNLNTDSSSPRVLWKVGCPNLGNDTGCTTGFSGIGQTWSAPKVLKAGGYGSGASPMVIFGGGYDSCEDNDPHTCTSSAKGRRVYLLDAQTGAKLDEFTTVRPVVADPFVVPDTTTGLAKFIYVVDLGGNIYRISGATAGDPIGTRNPDAAAADGGWTMTKIASLGCTDPAGTCDDNRKFMFMPDVVEPPAPGSGMYHLLVGSGDREKPLRIYDSALDTDNYFFMVKDVPTNDDWLTDETTNCDGDALICMDSLTPITTAADPSAEALEDSKGWYLGLTDGEQVVTSAITVYGTVTFSTHEPTDPEEGACEPDLGTARVYNIAYLNATSRNGTVNRSQEIGGGGLPPSPVAGLVKLDPNSPPIPFIIGADPDSPLKGKEPTPPSLTTQPKSLIYWYLQQGTE